MGCMECRVCVSVDVKKEIGRGGEGRRGAVLCGAKGIDSRKEGGAGGSGTRPGGEPGAACQRVCVCVCVFRCKNQTGRRCSREWVGCGVRGGDGGGHRQRRGHTTQRSGRGARGGRCGPACERDVVQLIPKTGGRGGEGCGVRVRHAAWARQPPRRRLLSSDALSVISTAQPALAPTLPAGAQHAQHEHSMRSMVPACRCLGRRK